MQFSPCSALCPSRLHFRERRVLTLAPAQARDPLAQDRLPFTVAPVLALASGSQRCTRGGGSWTRPWSCRSEPASSASSRNQAVLMPSALSSLPLLERTHDVK